jgi:hypothetical protein
MIKEKINFCDSCEPEEEKDECCGGCGCEDC